MNSSDSNDYSEVSFDFNEVILKESQVPAAHDLLEATVKYGMSYNSTSTGGGKTPMSVWITQNIAMKHGKNAKILVVGPATLNTNKKDTSPWAREATRYNMEVSRYISYQMLSGTTPTMLKNPKPIVRQYQGVMPKVDGQEHPTGYDNIKADFEWVDDDEYRYELKDQKNLAQMHYSSHSSLLMRKDILDSKNEYSTTEYSPTMDLMQFFMDNVVVLVIEEIQSTKNATHTNNATAAVIRAARRAWSAKGNTGAYILFLSASPFDSTSNALNFFRLIGFDDPVHSGKANDMFVKDNPWSINYAYKQSKVFAKRSAEKIKNSSQSKNKSNPAEKNKLAMMYLITCVMYRIHFASLNITPKQIWNAFLDIPDKKDRKYLQEAESLLQDVEKLQRKGDRGGVFNNITRAHGLMELSIAQAIAVDAVNKLNADPNCKCIIAFKRVASVDKVMVYLRESGYERVTLRIAGSGEKGVKGITVKEKEAALSKFQEDNNKVRCIVCISTRIAVGIDLDDKYGGRQRWTYTPGNYNRLESEQIYGRTPRIGCKSIPQILVCYPKTLGNLIMKVYESYREKSEVLAKILGSRISKNASAQDKLIHSMLVKTPNQYDVYIQLNCEELSYYKGSPSYKYETKTLDPEDPENYFYVGTNDDEGRENFASIEFMINYLNTQCDLEPEDRESDGIVFCSPEASSIVPSTDL